MSAPSLLWYGDDFTGAADTLATLAQAGWRAMLFLRPPSTDQIERAAQALGGAIEAIGVAGVARSLKPADLPGELEPVMRCFVESACSVLHYKVCSTFDSSPDIGNIAEAIRMFRTVATNPFVPIAGGQPSLGRFCAFSTLFASAGQGGTVERIDRHPTMAHHPVTPMTEADLRQHLMRQGLTDIAAWHLPAWEASQPRQHEHLGRLLDAGSGPILFDITQARHLGCLGELIAARSSLQPLLAVGASSVAQALSAADPRRAGAGSALRHQPPANGSRQGPAMILAGSLSPVTARQVQNARSYRTIRLDCAALLDPEHGSQHAHDQVLAGLESGENVLAVTAPEHGTQPDTAHSPRIAAATSAWITALLKQLERRGSELKRLGIAGGDTASLATRALPAWGLSYAGSLGPGAPIKRLHSESAALNGLELLLKGGQMGSIDLFDRFAAY